MTAAMCAEHRCPVIECEGVEPITVWLIVRRPLWRRIIDQAFVIAIGAMCIAFCLGCLAFLGFVGYSVGWPFLQAVAGR